MKIKNFEELAVTGARRSALEIAEAGLEAIDTCKVIKDNVSIVGKSLLVKGETFSLEGVRRLLVVGAGKCSLDAAATLEEMLGNLITGGLVIDVRQGKLKKIQAYQGTHPLPTDKNIEATKKLVELLSDLSKNDLVIFIVSGGGSTLLYLPDDQGTKEESAIVSSLMKTGATIQELNTVRKHLSLARGGYLAKYAYPAQVVSLIFSDVPTDDVDFIASGPTVKDTTTVGEAEAVLDKYNVLKICGLERRGLIETPKDDKYFERVKNVVVVSNKTALEAMELKAKELGFKTKVCTACLTGEAREVGLRIVEELKRAAHKTVMLYGGETTVTVLHNGKGGRNQELALSALRRAGPSQTLVTVASDGRDNTDFAGAICDILTKEKAAELNLDVERYLDENQSYEFWNKAGGYLLTGDTGSNVSDLIIAISG